MSQVSPVEREDWARKYREAVEPHLSGKKAEAVGTFSRPEPWWEGSDGAALIAGLIWLISRPFQGHVKGRLGDLPDPFLLAVTSDKVYAFSYAKTGEKFEVKDLVADFDRESITISKAGPGYYSDVVLRLVDGERRRRITINRNALDAEKDPWAVEVVAALAE